MSHNESTEARGVSAILLSAAFSAASGAGIYYAHQTDGKFSPAVGVLVRVVANLSCMFIPLMKRERMPRFLNWQKGRDLWIWGFFGALTVTTYFYAVTLLGAGKATMINAASGVFIVALVPLFMRQKLSTRYLLAASGSLAGMLLLGYPPTNSVSEMGIILAVLSGLFTALAYIMVAKSGKEHSPETVLLHWSAVNLVVMALAFTFHSWVWPVQGLTWTVLILTGLSMAWSQYLTTVAYQHANTSMVACLSFCGPLLNVVIDFYLFGLPFSVWSFLGVAFVLIFGLVIPLGARRQVEPAFG